MVKFFRKYHKWLGIIAACFLILFGISGIILNHRSLFSSLNVSRNILPSNYRFNNWNLGAIRGSEEIGRDSIVVYGSAGIWLTNTDFKIFSDFSNGIDGGVDDRKASRIYKMDNGRIFAGTLFGLFEYDKKANQWYGIDLPLSNPRIVDISQKQDTLLVMSRSHLLKSVDYKNFTKYELPESENNEYKVGLFKTIWVIHSGEILGIPGMLFVDMLGIIMIILSVTGIILFINKESFKRRKKKKKDLRKVKNINRWNLKWHNDIGKIAFFFLIIVSITGMFLRPPLLIPIASIKVGRLPMTTLDNENPWFDQLRRFIYDEVKDRYIIGTNSGIYFANSDLKSKLKPTKEYIPISVMGINVFERLNENEILIGSFEGLFSWNMQTSEVTNYISKKPYGKPVRHGPPIGSNIVSGYIGNYKGNEIYFDYGKGATSINRGEKFPNMPDNLKKQPLSMWNFMLEVHTARIFQPLIGGFYILIIPLIGLFSVFILVSGFVVWFKKFRKSKKVKN